MYGLVLMTALATGSGTPSYGDGAGCFGGGCYSCGGAVVSTGCYGSGCYSSGCYSSCNGCCGGGVLSRIRAAVGSRMSRAFLGGCSGSSCSGSCSGSSCYGSSYYGASYYGSSFVPAYGSSFGPAYYGSDFHGGSTGCTGCFGSTPVWGGAPPQVSIPSTPGEYRAARKSPTASPARLTVEVPADAKLFVDGQLTKGEGASRNFHTPELPIDQTFFYDLKAEVLIDGKVVSETKRVLVRSGEALSESFPKLHAAVKNADDTAVVTKR